MKFLKNIIVFITVFLMPAVRVSADNATCLPEFAESMQIRNLAHDKVLRPRNAGRNSGNPIVLYPSTSWKCLTWKAIPTKDGAVRLQNYFTNKSFVLDDSGQILQIEVDSSSEWVFEKLQDNVYRIYLKGSRRVLSADSPDKLSVREWTADDSQKWILEKGPARFSA